MDAVQKDDDNDNNQFYQITAFDEIGLGFCLYNPWSRNKHCEPGRLSQVVPVDP